MILQLVGWFIRKLNFDVTNVISISCIILCLVASADDVTLMMVQMPGRRNHFQFGGLGRHGTCAVAIIAALLGDPGHVPPEMF